MAFPTIPTGGRVITGVQANATSPRTFPNLSGLTKNPGDLLIAIIYCYQSSLTSAIFSSWGGGFTEIRDVGVASQHCVGIAYKISDGTETGTFTVAQAGTITGHAAMIVMSIPGAHASAAPEVLAALATGTAANADPGALNPSWGADDTLWITARANGETATGGTFTGLGAAPTNYGNAVQTGISGDVVGGIEAGVSFRQLNAASEDVGAGTADVSNARNASIVIAVRPITATTVSSSFTANAVIRKTQTATLTADAVLRAIAAASMTADAVLFRTQSHAFVVDALVSRTASATVTADAVIRATLTAGITVDAVILKTVAASFTADAVLLAARMAGFVADAVVLSPRTQSLTADAVLLATRTGVLTADATVQRTQPATVPADAVIRATVGGEFTADAFISAAGAGALTADAVLRSTRTQSFAADAIISVSVLASFVADAWLRATAAASFTADAFIRGLGGEATLTADAIFLRGQLASFTADAFISTGVPEDHGPLSASVSGNFISAAIDGGPGSSVLDPATLSASVSGAFLSATIGVSDE